MYQCHFYIIISLSFLFLGLNAFGQYSNAVSVKIIKQNLNTRPDNVVNIPLFVKNNSSDSLAVQLKVIKPEDWSLITKVDVKFLKPLEQKFIVISARVPARCPVGDYNVGLDLVSSKTGAHFAEGTSVITVDEVEKITLEFIESDENIKAGESYTGQFMVRNLGNSEKTVFIEATNCDVDGDVNVKLRPGESSKILVVKHTSEEIGTVRKEYIKVNVLLGGEVQDKIFRPLMIFPVKQIKKDLFFRYPVKASISYLATNSNEIYRSAYQFEFSGKGALDPEGKHNLEFIARGPNNGGLSYIGTYDQYFVSYDNKNLGISIGQKAYQFTPLTESSRYGFGIENKVMLNNGLSAGFIYVKPRYFQDIVQEMALYTKFENDKSTKLELYLIQKENKGIDDPTYLFSVSSKFKPLKTTSFEVEFSRGYTGEVADNAFRINTNSQISIFSISGVYYNVGNNYPGYYSNSKFYSGSLSARLSQKVNAGMFARRDFSNAQLDTFFVTAPYTKSMQYYLNYKIAPRADLRFYWRDYERKDRLAAQKFHYKTRTLNSQFSQKLNRFSYAVHGGYGKTTNYQLSEISNEQNTYRISANTGFQFNSKFSVKAFGSYSNLNSFVSGERRNATAGLSLSGQIKKKLRANLYLQNAYDIDDYYKNRNLMQFNLDYKISKNHEFSFRSYYTLFRNQTNNPDFFLSATYTYKFGVPLKQTTKAGDLTGRLTDDSGDPRKGVLLTLWNKTAITDNNGMFEFRTIPPGVYILSIDRSKFNLDEMPDIPKPIKVEIIEDQETSLNIGITHGSKLTGKFAVKASDSGFNLREKPDVGNIIIELGNDLERYRIATEKDGSFSFPLLLPGLWVLKIFESSLPKGFVLEKDEYSFTLKSEEQIDFDIYISQKERKIIFKSDNFSLSNSDPGGLKPLKNTTVVSPEKSVMKNEVIYTVQIGAFPKKLNSDSSFLNGYHFDFEKQINKLYTYFIGRFSSQEEANKLKEKLSVQFKGAFVVAFKNDKLIDINDQ